MGTVAKSTITLTSISDGYSLSLSPSSCVIHADYDGSNPVLANAKTTINVYCGDTKVPIAMGEVSTSDIVNISASCRLKDSYTLELTVLKLSTSVLEGYVSVDVIVSDYLTINAKFQFTIERETTMLDWILDWENNKTTIGDSYVITPKIFVGKKITGDHSSLSDVDGLTGVYIGPSNDDSCGVYGYNAGVEIFHLDETGGSIGGWDINSNGLVTENSNGRVGIYSDGTIAFYNAEGDAVWKLDGNGNALFAMGNVTFDSDGNARFFGEISSSEGVIGNWVIEDGGLSQSSIVLSSKNKYIAIINTIENLSPSNDFSLIKSVGGVAMYYTSSKAFGFLAYSGNDSKVFAAGSENYIAGWSFDENAIWLGTKNNNVGEYTANASSITLGTKGLRGCSWYINVDGTASFVKGWVTFGATEGKIAGWTLDKNSLWNGIKNDTLGEFTSASGSITIGSTGIRGYKWYLDTDGKASFAGGKVFFQTDGSGYVANQNLIWDASGAVTACGGNVKFNTDGSGYVAADNISWDKDGNIKLSENITALWGDGVSVAQKMALSTVLYRDTEFADSWNGLNIYLENNWVDVSCQNSFAYTLTSKGLYMLGYATILQVNLVATDGTVTKLWSGNQWADSTPVMITDSSSFQNLDTSSTLRIYFSGLKNEGCKVAIAHITATGDDGSIEDYDTFQLYGYDSNIGTTNICTQVTRTDDSTAPNSSQKILSIVDNFWYKNGDWRLGGVHFANQTRANGEFIVRIVALIPENWMIENCHNAYGGGKTTWITSQKGTGKWEDYVCLVKCGASGTFSTINHFALKLDPDGEYVVESTANTDDNLAISVKYKSGDDGFTFGNVTWKIAFATVYDATSSDKTLTTIDKNGIYTGTLRADQIIAGTIDATKIDADTILSNGSTWALNKDGSGYLANKNIAWTKDGSLSITGEVTATSGKVGNWWIVDGVITSDKTSKQVNYIKLDAGNRTVVVQSSSVDYAYDDDSYYTMQGGYGAILKLDGGNGLIQATAYKAPSYSTATSYISSNGIFSNIAQTNALPSSSGYTHQGAIVGLGFADTDKNKWVINKEQTIVAGVYGRAANSGTAPAFGGYFWDLKANGLVLNTKYIDDDATTSTCTLSSTTTCVIGLCNKNVQKTVYLPSDAVEGRIVKFYQMGLGALRIEPISGQHLYDDTSENEYYDCGCGQTVECVYGYWAKGDVNTQVWIIRRYSF